MVVLYWQNKDFPGNIRFDQGFRTTLTAAASGTIEYYAEYMDSYRFPGENQSQLLSDYLERKYTDRHANGEIDREQREKRREVHRETRESIFRWK